MRREKNFVNLLALGRSLIAIHLQYTIFGFDAHLHLSLLCANAIKKLMALSTKKIVLIFIGIHGKWRKKKTKPKKCEQQKYIIHFKSHENHPKTVKQNRKINHVRCVRYHRI